MTETFAATGNDHAASPRLIDSHVHIWSGAASDYPFAPLDNLAAPDTGRTYPDYRVDTADDGVDAVLLIQPRVYGYDHRYVYDVASSLPGNARVMPLINPRQGDANQLRERAGSRLTAGFRVIALGARPAEWLLDRPAHTIWSTATELRLPVGLLIDPWQLPQIAQVAAQHPGLTIIIDHMARCTSATWPQWRATLCAMADQQNVVVKLSAISTLAHSGFPHTDLWPMIANLCHSYGPTRLLWGSDWPHTRRAGIRRSRDAIMQALPKASTAELESVFSGTAARIFGFDHRNPQSNANGE